MWNRKAAQVIPIVISYTRVIPKSLSQSLTRLNLRPNTYIQLQKICNSWHMFNCKKLFKLQIRPTSLILLITTSQDRWIFPSQSWEMRNSIIVIIISLYLLRIQCRWKIFLCTKLLAFSIQRKNVLHVQSVVCWRGKLTSKNVISADVCYLRPRYGVRPPHTATVRVIVTLINLRSVKNTKPL